MLKIDRLLLAGTALTLAVGLSAPLSAQQSNTTPPAGGGSAPVMNQSQTGVPSSSGSHGSAQDATPGSSTAQGSAGSTGAMGSGMAAMNADQLKGKDLYGADNEKVGEIDGVLMGPDNKANSVLVDIGGFLGIGAKTVAIKWDEITPPQAGQDNADIKTTMTKQELEALPEFQYAENTDKGKVFSAPGGQSGSSGTSGSMPGRTTNPEGAPPAGTSGNDSSGTPGTGSGSR